MPQKELVTKESLTESYPQIMGEVRQAAGKWDMPKVLSKGRKKVLLPVAKRNAAGSWDCRSFPCRTREDH